MMYSGIPKWNRRLIKGTLALAWIMAAGGGFSNTLFGDRTVLTDIFGIVAVTMSVIAAAGVLLDRYRWEWVAAWFASAATAPCVIDAWRKTVEYGPENLSTAFLLTALIAFFALRALLCSAHAAKLRAIHEGQYRGDGDV